MSFHHWAAYFWPTLILITMNSFRWPNSFILWLFIISINKNQLLSKTINREYNFINVSIKDEKTPSKYPVRNSAYLHIYPHTFMKYMPADEPHKLNFFPVIPQSRLQQPQNMAHINARTSENSRCQTNSLTMMPHGTCIPRHVTSF